MFTSGVIVTTVLIFSLRLIWNYLAVSPSIPGPFLARFTDFWRAYQQYNGHLKSELLKLHSQHGPIVRYGVRSISITDPKAIEILYGSRGNFVIAHSYDVLVGISGGKEVQSLVSTRDNIRHGHLRRSVASAFTVRGALDYESSVDVTIGDLLRVLNKSLGHEFDLADLMMLYSMDSAARMAFSESLGCLETGNDVDGSIELIRDRFRHWGRWSSIPWVERLVYRNPWAMRRSEVRIPGSMVRTAALKTRARLDEPQSGDPDMLSKFVAAHKTNPGLLDMQGIVGLVMSTLSGAGDTTATTMTAIIFFLLKHPIKLEKLRAELVNANIVGDETPPFSTTSKLPYLAAIIKETMRLFPLLIWPSERLVPHGGVTVAGQYIPEGASVGVFTPAVHMDKSIFGTDAADFRPERWLDVSTEEVKRMEQAFMGFSRGKRVCLGQHVALLQMQKVVSVLVVNFDFGCVRSDAQLEADMSLAVVCLKPLWMIARARR